MQPDEGIVVALTSRRTPHFAQVLSKLADSGTRVREISGNLESAVSVSGIRGSTLVIYSAAGARGVYETVLPLAACMSKYRCVIIVVDRLDLGDYYALMRQGITGFFEMSEEPGRIAAGVQTLSHRFAA